MCSSVCVDVCAKTRRWRAGVCVLRVRRTGTFAQCHPPPGSASGGPFAAGLRRLTPRPAAPRRTHGTKHSPMTGMRRSHCRERRANAATCTVVPTRSLVSNPRDTSPGEGCVCRPRAVGAAWTVPLCSAVAALCPVQRPLPHSRGAAVCRFTPRTSFWCGTAGHCRRMCIRCGARFCAECD